MKGGFLHSAVMVSALASELRRRGATVRLEHPIRPGSRAAAVDLYAELSGVRLACEVELGPSRVLNDVKKADILRVDLLLIVTPTSVQADAIRRILLNRNKSSVTVRVMPFGAALRLLSDLSRLTPLLNDGTQPSPPPVEARR